VGHAANHRGAGLDWFGNLERITTGSPRPLLETHDEENKFIDFSLRYSSGIGIPGCISVYKNEYA